MVIKRLVDQKEFLMNENTELKHLEQNGRNSKCCLYISSENQYPDFVILKSFKTRAECERFEKEIEKARETGKEIFEF